MERVHNSGELSQVLTFANYSSDRTTSKASVITAMGEPVAPPAGYAHLLQGYPGLRADLMVTAPGSQDLGTRKPCSPLSCLCSPLKPKTEFLPTERVALLQQACLKCAGTGRAPESWPATWGGTPIPPYFSKTCIFSPAKLK